MLNCFQLSKMKAVKAKCKHPSPLIQNQIVYFNKPACFFTDLYFLGRVLWADNVSPRMDTIVSLGQFKSIRNGKKNSGELKFNIILLMWAVV